MFLKAYATPAGVPAAYARGLAKIDEIILRSDPQSQWLRARTDSVWPGTALGQTVDDVLASLPDIIKSGGDAATAIYRAVNAPSPTQYASMYGAAAPGTIFGMSAMTVLLVGGGLLFFLSRR